MGKREISNDDGLTDGGDDTCLPRASQSPIHDSMAFFIYDRK
jgi:hypothetical protein